MPAAKPAGTCFPALPVAQALKTEAPDTRILFVGTNAPFEVSTLARYGFDHKTIVSRPIKGGSLLSKAWSGAIVLVSVIQALWILIRFRANFVLGVGGFSSFALVLAARMLGRRTAIQEQNACPGMTNRMLAKVSHTIFIAFEQTRACRSTPRHSGWATPSAWMARQQEIQKTLRHPHWPMNRKQPF